MAAAVICSCGRSGTRQEEQIVTSRSIEAVLASHTDSLMAVPGVVGTAIGLCDGSPCIRVLLAAANEATQRRIPKRLEGYPVTVEVTGQIRPR